MGYAVGDRVEIKVKGWGGGERLWKVWLTEILPMKSNTTDQVWAAQLSRVSHADMIQESWITRKISSNFEGYK